MASLRVLQAQARDGFASLVAYFGENVAAYATDSDFWSGLAGFVASFSAAQAEVFKHTQVCLARWLMVKPSSLQRLVSRTSSIGSLCGGCAWRGI